MRVLQLNKFLKIVGGSETYMFMLSRLLQKNNIEVEFWGMEDPENIVEDKYGTFAKNIDFHDNKGALKNLSKVSKILYSKENQKRIAKLLDIFKPEIVHIHNYNFQLTTSVLSEIKKRGIKIVHTIHDSQLVCPNHRLYIAHKNEVCTKCLHGKFYNSISNKCFDNSLKKSIVGSAESYVTHNLLNVYNKHIDVFISPSNFFKELIQPVLNKEIIVLPNCVEKGKFAARPQKENYVLFFGRLSIEKGLHRLYELFQELSIPLKVIGKGDLVPPAHLNIEYLGPRYGDELFEIVAKAKFTIHPSFWYENCPMSIIESYMLGTPVIVSDHGGLPEMVGKQTGHMMNFYTPEAKTILQGLLENDYIFDVAIIEKFFDEKYGAEKHYQKIMSIYEEQLAN